MRQKPVARLIRGMAALVFLGTICALPLAFIGYLGYVEHNRRSVVLKNGEVAIGRVFESSQSISSRGCVFKYKYSFAGQNYTGGEGGCALVSDHQVGTSLVVRFIRDDPENSVAVGADLWPGWIAIPILLGFALIFAGGFMVFVIFSDVLRSPRRKRKSPG